MADQFPIVYDPARTPSGGPTFGAKSLLAHGIHEFGAVSLGIYNNRSVRGGTALSMHAEGRAIDFGYPYTVGGTPQGWTLANWLLRWHKELGVQQVIYARRIWRNTRDAEGWRHYGGTAAHYEHVHAELTRLAATNLSPTMIRQRTGHNDMAQNLPEAAVETLLIGRVKLAYELFPNRDPDLGGLRYWAGRIVDTYRAGGDPDRELHNLELGLLSELPEEERALLADLVTDSNG